MRNISGNKLNKFRYYLIIECYEYSLEFLMSACHCSVSTGVITKHDQPPWMSPI